MVKLAWLDDHNLLFLCPGCDCPHYVPVGNSPGRKWEWNGSMILPTFSPAFTFHAHDAKRRCHFEIRDGAIEFLPGCHHKHEGKTMILPAWLDVRARAEG